MGKQCHLNMKFLILSISLLTTQQILAQFPDTIVMVDDYYIQLDSMPTFGTYKLANHNIELQNFITENLQWPSKKDCVGNVFVEFIVEPSGNLTNIKTVIGLERFGCKEFDEEAERIIKLMPNWQPGYLNGEPVRTRMVVPIEFRI